MFSTRAHTHTSGDRTTNTEEQSEDDKAEAGEEIAERESTFVLEVSLSLYSQIVERRDLGKKDPEKSVISKYFHVEWFFWGLS